MRCTNDSCQSGDTRRISRTLQLMYSHEGKISSYNTREIWLCDTCHTPFFPSVIRGVPLIIRRRKPPTPKKRFGRPRKVRPPRRITKKEIIKELFES